MRRDMFIHHGITPDIWKTQDEFDLMELLSVPNDDLVVPGGEDTGGGFYDDAQWDVTNGG